MIAKAKIDILILQCPICQKWYPADMNDTNGHFEAFCESDGFLAWGLEQDIEQKVFKGKAWTE